jgi:serine/threonine-protein kinase
VLGVAAALAGVAVALMIARGAGEVPRRAATAAEPPRQPQLQPQPQPGAQPQPMAAGTEHVMEGETVAKPEKEAGTGTGTGTGKKRPVKSKVDEPATAAGPPGYYLVDSQPYARIYIDGKDQGETPLFRVPLSPGKHQVKAVLGDGRKKQFTIDIKSGKDLSSGRLRW